MSRHKHSHEEHANHEAWAIPYGDLVTLLLAFFVVMYSISSVNEGKYRVVSDSLAVAFGSGQKALPVQIGDVLPGGAGSGTATSIIGSQLPRGLLTERLAQALPDAERQRWLDQQSRENSLEQSRSRDALSAIATDIERALDTLILDDVVQVYRRGDWLEVEIKSDTLFASGSAAPLPGALAAVTRVAEVLRESPNLIRVEGHTDIVPITTAVFPSNWELSAARSASIVRVLTNSGVAPGRLTVVGYGEHQPIADNSSEAGRNSNRRVVLVILARNGDGDSLEPPTSEAGA
ncbi:flagellar motor protein MotD [Aquimonas sp.]|jgi:chemotaxis protein MotB|uniref:flagellar motor protein MotD n=1 Tax=Aquimonas sp. TaxID=1872588 RepID=UPI0037BE7A82